LNETITGMALVVAIACLFLVYGFIIVFGSVWRYRLWTRTQATPPEPGQVWNQHGGKIYVISVTDNGIETCMRLRALGGGHKTEWDESLSAWKNRVQEKHLYLMEKETEKFRKLLESGVDQ
jgi:hypothetical protein